MNSYLGATVTYDLNPYTEVVDASVISQWLTVDENMNVTFNEDGVRNYVRSLLISIIPTGDKSLYDWLWQYGRSGRRQLWMDY